MRKIEQEYPDYTGEIDALDELKSSGEYLKGLPKLLNRIIQKHKPNADYTRSLYKRYKCVETGVPIFKREPRYPEEVNAINNKLNNDFFGEVIDFGCGYIGDITYSYAETEESQQTTSNNTTTDKAVEIAIKTLSDFVYLNSMTDKDNSIKLLASTCGYCGRLLYTDKDGIEKVAVTLPYETIVLSKTELTEPQYALRYFPIKDVEDNTKYKVEFYDGDYYYRFEGGSYSDLKLIETKETLFGGLCPLQIIPKNSEMMGDGEKVISLIDAYDRAMSDCNNDVENNATSILAFENIMLKGDQIDKVKMAGSIDYKSTGQGNAKIYYVTKDINDAYIEHHLDRLKNDIYRFSKTPNLSDGTFGAESGEARKFRMSGVETRCKLFEAKLKNAGIYMFRLLSEAWKTKGISVDPMQCYMTFKRNFPLDISTEVDAIVKLISAGYPKKAAFELLSFVDDVDMIMDMIEEEKDQEIVSLMKRTSEDIENEKKTQNDVF